MRQTSFTFDVIPSATVPGKANVYVKTLDVENGTWGPVKYLLETDMLCDLDDVPETAKSWAAVETYQRALRLLVAHYQQQHERA